MSQAETSTSIEAEVLPPHAGLHRKLEQVESRVASLEARVEANTSMLDAVLSAIPRLEKGLSTLEEFRRVAVMIGEWKRRNCKYHHNGLCRAWRAREGLGIPVERDEEGMVRPRVDANPVLCALCPLYEPRR